MYATLSKKTRNAIIQFALMGAIHSEAAVRYVDAQNRASAPPYTSWPTAATNIQDAVDLSADGDSVLVAEGTYLLRSEITVTNNINLLGAGDPERTVIDGGHNSYCLHLGTNAGVVAEFTICNGLNDRYDEGGGIYCESRDPVVLNCIVRDNTSGGMRAGTAYHCKFRNNDASHMDGGGGMSGGIAYDCSFVENEASDGGALRLSDAFGCLVVSNTAATYGGGMYGGSASNCTFSGNQARYGGAVAHGTVIDCEVRQNRANPDLGGFGAGEGGGLYESDAVNLLLEHNYAYWHGGGICGGSARNCTITGNDSDEGGGAYNATVRNCLVTNNGADHGGGIYLGVAVNCTITGNMGWIDGTWEAYATMTNCIVVGVDENYGLPASGSSYTHCRSPNAVHGVNGNITNTPEFIGSGNYRLAFDSPCIDAGNNAVITWPKELGGGPRIVNGTVDMGAYEYDPAVADSDGDGIHDEWEITYFSCATGCVATGNADGDPGGNLEEFIAGTDPTNAWSYFEVKAADAVDGGFVVDWEAVSGRRYGVDWSAALAEEFQSLEQDISYPRNSYTDTVHVAEEQGFYRLNVERN